MSVRCFRAPVNLLCSGSAKYKNRAKLVESPPPFRFNDLQEKTHTINAYEPLA